jgi:membrane-bound acyltransferase YfiQ involved in biofilm formation
MIKRLLYLNGLAIITVILYHASAWGFIAMFYWTDRYRPVTVPNFDMLGGATYFSLRAIEQLIIYGIPTFMFVSGFFIAISTGRSQKAVPWRLVYERIKNLAIPFVLWSLIILGLNFAQGARYTPGELVRTIALGQTTDAYYFVPVLIQLYIVAPLITPLARKNWKLLLLMAAVLQISVLTIRYTQILGWEVTLFDSLNWLTRSWFFGGYVFFFSLGITIGFHLPAFKDFLSRFRWIFLGAVVTLFVVGMVEWELLLRWSGQEWIGPRETIIDQLYAAAFLLTYISFDRVKLPFSKQISSLGAKSYGIYLTHSPVLEYTSRILYHVAPAILAFQFIFQPILYVAGFGLPLLMMALVNRSPVRRFYAYIFG